MYSTKRYKRAHSVLNLNLNLFKFRSIITFILFFRKNKHQIHSYTISNRDDFKSICIYENLLIFAYFFKRREDFLVYEKNSTFSKVIPRVKHVLNTFKLRSLWARLYLFVVYILFALVISTSIRRYVKNSPDTKVLMMVIETEKINKFPYLEISVFLLSSYCMI